MKPQPKRKPYRNKKILNHARGQQCMIESQYCNHNTETTVAAHSGFYEDGSAGSQKADDCFVAFACSGCHDWIDGRVGRNGADEQNERRLYFHRGMKRTWRKLLDDGILK